MSLVNQISDVVTDIGTEFKTVYGEIGDLPSLGTTAKNNLVAAINEVLAEIAGGGGAVIDDAAPSTGKVYSSQKTEDFANAAAAAVVSDAGAVTDHAYSSQKTTDLIAALKTELVNGAGAALDTFGEVAAQLAADETAAAALTTAVGNRVRFDDAQVLTGPQKAQAIANIGAISASDIGDPTTDFAAVFAAALT